MSDMICGRVRLIAGTAKARNLMDLGSSSNVTNSKESLIIESKIGGCGAIGYNVPFNFRNFERLLAASGMESSNEVTFASQTVFLQGFFATATLRSFVTSGIADRVPIPT